MTLGIEFKCTADTVLSSIILSPKVMIDDGKFSSFNFVPLNALFPITCNLSLNVMLDKF